jgi:hypothetical protein
MFQKIINALFEFKEIIDNKRKNSDEFIEHLRATYKEPAASSEIKNELENYTEKTAYFRQAFLQIVTHSIDEIRGYILREANKIDLDNIRAVQNLSTVDIPLSDLERDSIMKQFDRCYLAHRILMNQRGINPTTAEFQIALLDRLQTDMEYLANGYNGEVSIDNATPEGAAMLRIMSTEYFEELTAEFDKDSPYTTSAQVVEYLTPLTDEEIESLDSLFKDSNTLEDMRDRANILSSIPGMRDKLLKSSYARFLDDNTVTGVEGFLTAAPTYLQRGFVASLVALGYRDAVLNSKFVGLLTE